ARARAAAGVSARTPNAPAAHRPRPGMARREDPPVIWITVARPPCAFRNRAEALRAAYAPRTGDVAQRSKLSGSLSASVPPPNGPAPPAAADVPRIRLPTATRRVRAPQ